VLFWVLIWFTGAALFLILAAMILLNRADRPARRIRIRWRWPWRRSRKETVERMIEPVRQPPSRLHIADSVRGTADYQRWRDTPSGSRLPSGAKLLDDPPPGPDDSRPAQHRRAPSSAPATAVVPEPRTATDRGARVEYALAPELAVAPRFLPGSKVSQLPWELPMESASPPGVAADQGELGELRVRAASVIGAGHRSGRSVKPRQDAYRVARDRAGHHLVVAVADGMSDSARSEFGASVAVGTVVALIRRHLDDGRPLDGLQAAALFSEVSSALVQAAGERQLEASDVRTTLAVAVFQARCEPGRPSMAWVAQIADTHMWLRTEDGWGCVTGTTKDSYDGSVLDAYLPHVPQAARGFSFEVHSGDTFAVLSDGVSDAFSTVAGAAGWFARRWREPPPLASFVLDVDFEAKTLQDDRTAVVVWTGDATGGVSRR
jgi:hypothetical protein